MAKASDQTTLDHEGPRADVDAFAPDLEEVDGLDRQLGRFAIVRKLGAGGMGMVYEALDADRGARVALKTLRSVTPRAAQRFKQEFRALADVTHPNVVRLFELFATGRQLYFTMERVEGVDFLTWVRAQEDSVTTGDDRPRGGDARLRETLRQLVSGVDAIHHHGKLHRDLKPSNVLVEANGRVVVLDFGLVRDADPVADGVTVTGAVMGTPAYMSPEQASGGPVGPPSDWYAVGVMLHQALTGRLPMAADESDLHMLLARHDRDALPPSHLVPGVPPDLDRLCVELLARRPEDRPTAEAILALLPARAPESKPAGDRHAGVPLVGRDAALAALREASDAASLGRTVVVTVDGVSGVGKSTLVDRFLYDLRRRDATVVLRGRCYERESVPYKAWDSVVDDLARYLGRMPATEAAALLPRDVYALTRLFPVLRAVDVIDAAPRRRPPDADERELRRRGFAAFKELVGRLTDRRPVALYIDDLQWTDEDSIALLLEVLRPPDAPALLLVATGRRDDEDFPLLRRFHEGLREIGRAVDVRRLPVDPLPPEVARELGEHLLRLHGAAPTWSESVARESEGLPFLAGEIARYLATHAIDPSAAPPRLDVVLRDRIERLPPRVRSVLETVAVASGRIPLPWALAAAPGDEGPAALSHLQGESLVRTSGPRARAEVEPYHDRIRAAVIAALDPERAREIHERLAEAIDREPEPDPERSFQHWRDAGRLDRAAACCVQAAERAMAGLAFDRAAELYGEALALGGATGQQAGRLQRARGDALANAGRGHEAAHAWLLAFDLLAADETADLRRRAAEHLLASGHTEEGRRVLHEALAASGMRLPASRGAALRGLMLRRARVRLRGLGFRPTPAASIAPARLTLIDMCWSAARGLTVTDIFTGAYFQAEHLLLALDAGEPGRVAAALAREAFSASFFGGRGLVRAQRLIDRVRELAEAGGDAAVHVHADVAASLVHLMNARWREAIASSERAEVRLRDECPWMVHELFDAQAQACGALLFLGHLGELETRANEAYREASIRSDVYHAIIARMYKVFPLAIARDDRAGAEELLDALREEAHGRGLQIADVQVYTHRAAIDLYTRTGPELWSRREEDDRMLAGNPLMRALFLRAEIAGARGRCALGAAESDAASRSQMFAHARRAAKELARISVPSAPPQALMIEAGIAHLQGRLELAAELLQRALTAFENLRMVVYASAARLRLGALVAGDDGRTQCRRGEAALVAQGVVDPARFVRIYAPGF